jgi:hypothetical protein
MSTMNKTCRCLVGFEEAAAAIYLNLARQFAKNKELSWFWMEMSMEEKQHAVLLEFCGCQDLLGNNMPDRSTIRQLSNLLEDLQKKAGSRNLSVDDAFLIAAQIEASEINGIYGRLIGPVRGTPYILRKKIEALGTDHLQELLRGARKFKVSPPTMATLLELKRRETRKAS